MGRLLCRQPTTVSTRQWARKRQVGKVEIERTRDASVLGRTSPVELKALVAVAGCARKALRFTFESRPRSSIDFNLAVSRRRGILLGAPRSCVSIGSVDLVQSGSSRRRPGVATAPLRSSLIWKLDGTSGPAALSLPLLNSLHRLLVFEACFLCADALLLRHDEVLATIEAAQVVASRIVGGNHATLVVGSFLELEQVDLRASADHHIHVVIDGGRSCVLRTRGTGPVRERETRSRNCSGRLLTAPLARKRLLGSRLGLHRSELQTTVRTVVLENRQGARAPSICAPL